MNQTEKIKRVHIRRILYEYRQQHGVPADLYIVSVGTPNYQTGRKGVALRRIHIPQFVTGSVSLSKKFDYDISYIKANSNFAYGGFFEVGDRFGIIDGIYLNELELKQEDYIVYDGKRFDFKSIEQLDARTGYALHLRMVKDATPQQIHEVTVISSVTVDQEVSYEL